MNNKTWTNLKDIFAKASEMNESQRNQYLVEVCEGNPTLREEVESLLASFEKSEQFIEKPAIDFKEVFAPDKRIGQKIGNYKIVKELGHGGMGVVYLAAREDEIRQRVAVKLVRGLDTQDVLRRFKNERQILASLRHPNICQLLDAGTTEDGLPFFVMEYVGGLPLLDFCNEQQFSTNERLDLFKTVCSAVQHAHQNLVVHRDLKPNNILITHKGEVKLLDFGVAKFLNPELAGELNYTQTQFRVMTPEYASPEQIKGSHITTASDIYSLGVILYELLTGERPYKLEGKNLEEVLKTINEIEPNLPSAVVSRKISTDETNRKTKIKNQKSLSGDLDNIVLMALRKEPARRYQSVSDFSEDIQRYLKGLPVIARPNTLKYRAEKFVKRNLAASVISILLILSLIGGLGFSLWQWNAARKESAKARKINEFLQKTFTEAPFEEKGQNLKFAEVLDTASQRAETELVDEPEVKAQVLATLSETYVRIGNLDRGEEKAGASLELMRQLYGEKNTETSKAYYRLAHSILLKGKLDDSEQFFSKAAEIERQISPDGSALLGGALTYLGEIQVRKAKLTEAVKFTEEAVSINSKFSGELSTVTSSNYTILGRAKERLGLLDDAEKHYRQSLKINQQLLPGSRISYAESMLGLGIVLAKKEKFEEAEPLLLETKTIFSEVQGANSMQSAEIGNYLLIFYYLKGDYQKTESLGIEIRKMFIDNGGKDTNGYFATLEYLGVAMAKNGKANEGETMLREAQEKRLKTAVPNDWRIFNSKNLLAVCLTEQNKFDEAEKLLLESKDFFNKTYGEKDYRTLETDKYLTALIDKRNKLK